VVTGAGAPSWAVTCRHHGGAVARYSPNVTRYVGDQNRTRVEHVREAWTQDIGPGERAAIVAWGSFAATFGSVRALTHWIRAGHGPSGGGMSVGGRHFHHYNLGIALLTGIGAITIRGAERHRRHLGTAAAYGAATALIADEAALLIDLEDVYWAREGRASVDIAVGIIAAGGLAVAGVPWWQATHDRVTGDTRS